MIRMEIDGLTERQKQEFGEWMRAILFFDDEEWEAFAGLAPMTQELFCRCMKRCVAYNNDTMVFRLMKKYPNHLAPFIRKMEGELKLMRRSMSVKHDQCRFGRPNRRRRRNRLRGIR